MTILTAKLLGALGEAPILPLRQVLNVAQENSDTRHQKRSRGVRTG